MEKLVNDIIEYFKNPELQQRFQNDGCVFSSSFKAISSNDLDGETNVFTTSTIAVDNHRELAQQGKNPRLFRSISIHLDSRGYDFETEIPKEDVETKTISDWLALSDSRLLERVKERFG